MKIYVNACKKKQTFFFSFETSDEENRGVFNRWNIDSKCEFLSLDNGLGEMLLYI